MNAAAAIVDMKTLIKLSLTFAFLHCILAGCANAQTIDLSTDEAVVEQFGKQKNEKLTKDDVCIKRSARVIVIGYMGCSFHAAFVNSVYLEESADLSKNALNALGWKEANQREREELAKLWVDKGLLAFSTVLYTKGDDFVPGRGITNRGAIKPNVPEFHPPQVVSGKNGEVVVTLWVRFEDRKIGRKIGLLLNKGFARQGYTFSKDGSLLEEQVLERLFHMRQF